MKIQIKSILIGIVFILALSSKGFTEPDLASANCRIENGLYVPQSIKQVQDFWKIPELSVVDTNTKTFSYDICLEYLNVLFDRSKSNSDLRKILIFYNHSDGFGAELFAEYWQKYIKSHFTDFRLFYCELSNVQRDSLSFVLSEYLSSLSPSEKHDAIQGLNLDTKKYR